MKDAGIFWVAKKKQGDFFGLRKRTQGLFGYAKKVVIFWVDKF